MRERRLQHVKLALYWCSLLGRNHSQSVYKMHLVLTPLLVIHVDTQIAKSNVHAIFLTLRSPPLSPPYPPHH